MVAENYTDYHHWNEERNIKSLTGTGLRDEREGGEKEGEKEGERRERESEREKVRE